MTGGDERRTDDPWAMYRARRTQFLAVWIGGFFVVWGFFLVVAPFANERPWLAAPIFAIWAAAFLVTFHRWSSFMCPWCRRPFFRRPPWTNLLTRRCLHCTAAKWTTPPSRV